MTSRRRWWLIYTAAATAVVLALAWITWVALGLERAELAARTDARHQESIRLALWRMDSWLGPHLARESARPASDYRAFAGQPLAYTRLLSLIEPGDVLTPSPLLSFQSDYLVLHFQIEEGRLSSPQVPTGNLRDLAEAGYLPADRIDLNRASLETVSNLVTPAELNQCVTAAETAVTPLESPQPAVDPVARAPSSKRTQTQRTQREQTRRQQAYLGNALDQQVAQIFDIPDLGPLPGVTIGPLVPVWVGTGETAQLIFVRRVRTDGASLLQGFLCEWPRLRQTLLEQIADLLDGARLAVAATAPIDRAGPGTRLATIPVSLEVAPPTLPATSLASPTRVTLSIAWLAVLAGLAATAVTLQASVRFGERRSRFASAVTHELRTPLTTFRMYTEMLADDMVPDEARRREYLATLKSESARLSTLVENVMSYARLEQGQRATRLDPVRLSELLERVRPALQQRAEAAAMTLDVHNDLPTTTTLMTDVDAVGQILFNLVDNACKYAPVNGSQSIELSATLEGRTLHLDVRDHGPGVPACVARAVFTPFERGTNDTGDIPGLGLGLALAAGLARDLGGSLLLVPPDGDGACFRLTMDVAPDR